TASLRPEAAGGRGQTARTALTAVPDALAGEVSCREAGQAAGRAFAAARSRRGTGDRVEHPPGGVSGRGCVHTVGQVLLGRTGGRLREAAAVRSGEQGRRDGRGGNLRLRSGQQPATARAGTDRSDVRPQVITRKRPARLYWRASSGVICGGR